MIVSNYVNTNVVDEFIKQKDSITSILITNLARENYSLSDVSIGTPFNLHGTDEYYFPVISDGKIITFVDILYNFENHNWIGIDKHFADGLNNLDKPQAYVIYRDEKDNVFAISDKDSILISNTLYNNTSEDMAYSLSSMSINNNDVVNVKESIFEIDLSSHEQRFPTNGKWLYNFPHMKQTLSDNCWATAMTILLNGNGYSTTVAQVQQKTGNLSGGANASSVNTYFNQNYGINSKFYGYAYFSDYVSEINSGRAVYQSLEGGVLENHAVVIMGYSYDDQPNTNVWVAFIDPSDGNSYDKMVNGDKFMHGGRTSISIVYNILLFCRRII